MTTRAGAIIIGLMAALTSFVVVLAVIVFSLQHDLKANIDSQVPNRVKNVAVWCGAINASRDYDRQLVAGFGQIHYVLPDLNCAMLERKTAASAQK